MYDTGLGDHRLVLLRTGLAAPAGVRQLDPEVVEWDRQGDWVSALASVSAVWTWLADRLHQWANRAPHHRSMAVMALAWAVWTLEAVALILGYARRLVVVRTNPARGAGGWAASAWLRDRHLRGQELARKFAASAAPASPGRRLSLLR